MVNKLTHKRITTIQSNAENFIKGKISYFEAFETAKKEGLLGFIRNYNNQEKHDAIKTAFLNTLQKIQVAHAITAIDKLVTIHTDNKTTDCHHALYQQTFSNINFENSNVKVEIANLQANNDSLTIQILIHDKNTKNHRMESRIIKIGNEQTRNRILAEYMIFKHKQFGSEEINNHTFKESPEVSNLIKEYSKNSKKFQYDAICFSGGGAKGIGYLGVAEGLGGHRLRQVNSVSGSSAGAIFASLTASGMEPYELIEFTSTQNLKVDQKQVIELMRSTIFKSVIDRLIEYRERGNKLSPEKDELIRKIHKTKDITFNDLEQLIKEFPNLGFKNLFINAHLANSHPPREIELSVKNCPDMPISLATAASAALPILFKPIDGSNFFSPAVREKLMLDQIIKLDDGGITNNTPYNYLKNSSNPLILSFSDDKSIYKKSLSIPEKIKHLLADAPAYIYRRADVYEMEKKIGEPFYLNTQTIETISFKEAAKKVITLNWDIKDDFIKYEINRPDTFDLKNINDTIQKIIKFNIFPLVYCGTLDEHKFLLETYKDQQCYLDFLTTTKSEDEFRKCYNQLRTRRIPSLPDI